MAGAVGALATGRSSTRRAQRGGKPTCEGLLYPRNGARFPLGAAPGGSSSPPERGRGKRRPGACGFPAAGQVRRELRGCLEKTGVTGVTRCVGLRKSSIFKRMSCYSRLHQVSRCGVPRCNPNGVERRRLTMRVTPVTPVWMARCDRFFPVSQCSTTGYTAKVPICSFFCGSAAVQKRGR